MPFRSTNEGFMEPTRHVTYYEDAYTKFKNKDNFVEADDFDVCEDSSEEDCDNPKTKHKRRHIDSYGSIKKPTCKQPFNLTTHRPLKVRANKVKTSPESKRLHCRVTRYRQTVTHDTRSG
jgi:hypothetical protein